MKIRYTTAFCGAALILALGFLSAQDLRRVHFGGTISDYGPSTVSGGPWEIRGQWSLDVDRSGAANFSTDLTMETSDYGISGNTQVNPANPGTRTPHTHHVTLTNGTVSYDATVCPANSPATTGSGVVVTGTATTTAKGARRPLSPRAHPPFRSASQEVPKSSFRT